MVASYYYYIQGFTKGGFLVARNVSCVKFQTFLLTPQLVDAFEARPSPFRFSFARCETHIDARARPYAMPSSASLSLPPSASGCIALHLVVEARVPAHLPIVFTPDFEK